MTGTLVWITGLPSAGKSRFARAVQAELGSRGVASCLLDGDDVRHALVPNPGYDAESRDRFYATLGNLAVLLAARRSSCSWPRRHTAARTATPRACVWLAFLKSGSTLRSTKYGVAIRKACTRDSERASGTRSRERSGLRAAARSRRGLTADWTKTGSRAASLCCRAARGPALGDARDSTSG